MSRFASGLTAITGITADGRPAGLICQVFSSVSLSPPLILVCVARTSTTWPTIRITGQFSVNILSRARFHHPTRPALARRAFGA
jgi:3-hydroxy-9,10-secoandrosta-1,3,5(10)-triene-9,17-dione monooxygenase reductase component